MTRFARYAWSVLAINLLVILWGAFVRASGSGAGCGAHWPLCNGEVVPPTPAAATLIEFSHRLSSGLALAAVLVLVFWARRALPAGHPARNSAYASALFIVTEALVGAGLVLFEMVAQNASVARAWWVSAHLTNTFLLLAALTLTASFAGGARAPRLRGSGAAGAACAVLAAFALALGASGAVTALGDTLFPAGSLREGLAQDFGASAHLFLRLRVWHPVLAVAFGVSLVLGTRALARRERGGAARRWANVCAALVALQLGVGAVNLLTLAPIAFQLAHLFVADLLWIALVLFVSATLATASPLRSDRRAYSPEARRGAVSDQPSARAS